MLLSDLTGDDFRSQLLQALQDPEVINFLHQASDFNEGPLGLHHELGNRHDQSSYGDHNHDGISSAILSSGYVDLSTAQNVGGTKTWLGQAIFEAGILLNTQTFPNIQFAPGAGAVTTQIIAGSSLNFDVATGNAFNFRSGINGTAFLSLYDSGSMQLSGAAAEYNFHDRDGIGGDYFSWYASSGGASLYSSVLGGNAFTVFENGNASTIGSHFFQSPSYGGRFGAGNDSGGTTLVQIAFGYHGVQDSYRHEIRTAHDGGAAATNVMDFYIWTPAVATTADPTVRPLRLAGDGTVTFGGNLVCANIGTRGTSVSGGTAQALPANPDGYMGISINGVGRVIPYYH